MEEEQTQEIMSKYLEGLWKVKLKPKKSGPDFLHKGDVVEVKGSNFKWHVEVKQFAQYAQEYDEVGLAFPTDALDTRNLVQLDAFTSISIKAFSKYIKIYLITDILIKRQVPNVYPAKYEERFGVCSFWDGSEVLPSVMASLKVSAEFVELTNAEEKRIAIKNWSYALDNHIKEAARNYVVMKADVWIPP